MSAEGAVGVTAKPAEEIELGCRNWTRLHAGKEFDLPVQGAIDTSLKKKKTTSITSAK